MSEKSTDPTNDLLGESLESVFADAGFPAVEENGHSTRPPSYATVMTSQSLLFEAADESLRNSWPPGSDEVSDTDSFYSATSEGWAIVGKPGVDL